VYATPARCAIVGAGIAGASIAHALALRGWVVTVFDPAEQPAAGASGLPVGLAVPHVSADDNPRSRLSRSGVQLLHQHAQRMLVRGQDWDPSGVTEHRPDGSKLWHADACWIKPAALVRAWLAHPGIRFAGSCRVTTLQHASSVWQLAGDQGQDLGSFETVVVANAVGSADLLCSLPTENAMDAELHNKLARLQAVHGTLSYGMYAQPLPSLPQTPVNGEGCFIPHVPYAHGEQWFAGSTFETDAVRVVDQAGQHAANMARLQQLLAMDGPSDVEGLTRGPVSQWSGTRCVTHDRLPLVGPVETVSGPGLWLCAGMGSRGLSFSALCAELLVARLGAEPLPMAFSLSRSLDVNRVRRGQPVPPAR
jgi:tRNA 5-methylaminomethyl-2-thiouridine biosynthesis bifunctional protein